MTCAKNTVTCTIFPRHADSFIASNACDTPQRECPRAPGEGYTKCQTICHQQGHAEIQAVAEAKRRGIDLRGADAIITGHTYACRDCQEALFGAGVRWLRVLPG